MNRSRFLYSVLLLCLLVGAFFAMGHEKVTQSIQVGYNKGFSFVETQYEDIRKRVTGDTSTPVPNTNNTKAEFTYPNNWAIDPSFELIRFVHVNPDSFRQGVRFGFNKPLYGQDFLEKSAYKQALHKRIRFSKSVPYKIEDMSHSGFTVGFYNTVGSGSMYLSLSGIYAQNEKRLPSVQKELALGYQKVLDFDTDSPKLYYDASYSGHTLHLCKQSYPQMSFSGIIGGIQQKCSQEKTVSLPKTKNRVASYTVLRNMRPKTGVLQAHVQNQSGDIMTNKRYVFTNARGQGYVFSDASFVLSQDANGRPLGLQNVYGKQNDGYARIGKTNEHGFFFTGASLDISDIWIQSQKFLGSGQVVSKKTNLIPNNKSPLLFVPTYRSHKNTFSVYGNFKTGVLVHMGDNTSLPLQKADSYKGISHYKIPIPDSVTPGFTSLSIGTNTGSRQKIPAFFSHKQSYHVKHQQVSQSSKETTYKIQALNTQNLPISNGLIRYELINPATHKLVRSSRIVSLDSQGRALIDTPKNIPLVMVWEVAFATQKTGNVEHTLVHKHYERNTSYALASDIITKHANASLSLIVPKSGEVPLGFLSQLSLPSPLIQGDYVHISKNGTGISLGYNRYARDKQNTKVSLQVPKAVSIHNAFEIPVDISKSPKQGEIMLQLIHNGKMHTIQNKKVNGKDTLRFRIPGISNPGSYEARLFLYEPNTLLSFVSKEFTVQKPYEANVQTPGSVFRGDHITLPLSLIVRSQKAPQDPKYTLVVSSENGPKQTFAGELISQDKNNTQFNARQDIRIPTSYDTNVHIKLEVFADTKLDTVRESIPLYTKDAQNFWPLPQVTKQLTQSGSKAFSKDFFLQYQNGNAMRFMPNTSYAHNAAGIKFLESLLTYGDDRPQVLAAFRGAYLALMDKKKQNDDTNLQLRQLAVGIQYISGFAKDHMPAIQKIQDRLAALMRKYQSLSYDATKTLHQIYNVLLSSYELSSYYRDLYLGYTRVLDERLDSLQTQKPNQEGTGSLVSLPNTELIRIPYMQTSDYTISNVNQNILVAFPRGAGVQIKSVDGCKSLVQNESHTLLSVTSASCTLTLFGDMQGLYHTQPMYIMDKKTGELLKTKSLPKMAVYR